MTMFEEYNDILTIDEVCEALMIGRNNCYKLLGNAKIKGFRIGGVWKVPREAVISFVRESSASRIPEISTKNAPGPNPGKRTHTMSQRYSPE